MKLRKTWKRAFSTPAGDYDGQTGLAAGIIILLSIGFMFAAIVFSYRIDPAPPADANDPNTE